MSSSAWLAWVYGNLSDRRRPQRRTYVPVLDLLEDRIIPAVATQIPALMSPSDHLSASDAAASQRLASRPLRKGPSLLSVTPLSNTTLLLRFNKKLNKNTVNRATFLVPGLVIVQAQLLRNQKSVLLITSPQEARPYNVLLNNLRTQDGNAVGAPRISATVEGMAAPPVAAPAAVRPPDTTPPRVVGAVSTSNTTLLVSFSEPVAETALSVRNYSIRQTTFNPDAGFVRITQAVFADPSQRTVLLTTLPQNDLNYVLHAINIEDLAGNALAAPIGSFGGNIDLTSALFKGTAPPGGTAVDTDGDGLPDNVEQRGWIVTSKLLDGTRVSRGVSSDPLNPDTDGDGLSDQLEMTLAFDPRNPDTDFDQLTDNQEYNEIFSDGTSQDTDGDGLDDAAEFNFFRTSVVHADTDGDQLPDGAEILLANRNPRVADLPTPAIEIGDLNLQLDVRFTETTSTGTNVVENRTVNSQLSQSARKEHSNSNSNTQEAFFKLASGFGFENSVKYGTDSIGGGVKNTFSVNAETGWTGSWTSSYTSTSAAETQQEYAESLSTNAEVTQGATVERQVLGARLSVTVFLKNASTLAYNVKNLQVTAFLQDPQTPGRLTPLATLLPENAPDAGFNLGPLVPERGPFIFASETIFPSQVENLMRNPTGVVFKIANFDITDELGRNFAFTSKDIFDRTGSLVIDFGGFDSDGDGEGDLTETHRIATDGGRVIDTNADGKIDTQDHRVVFDGTGKQVGLSLRDALEAIGLKHFDEKTNPTSSLPREVIQSSYSTLIDAAGQEQIARIRDVGAQVGVRKAWVVLTPTGIDPTRGLDNTILTTASDIKLAYVQDLDGDLVPANVEALFGTSDLLQDTDGDTLDDRFETLIGWNVDLGAQGFQRVFSRGNLADSDGDGLSDPAEAPEVLTRNARGLIIAATRGAPFTIGGATFDVVTNPLVPDTDRDGIGDNLEVVGYSVTLRSGAVVTVKTDPANADTDGDTASDGLERRLGGDPTNAADRDTFADDDFDGLSNIQEITGWDVVYRLVSTSALAEGTTVTVRVTSDPRQADTDGDGIPDGEESGRGLHPRQADTDGDGLTDFQEVRGFQLRDQGILKTNPLDADHDNDMRSDGDEAELIDVEAKRWIVRPVGKTSYRVYSDPLQADADFDGVVDGDEYAWNSGLYRSDPNKANTDGDNRTDGEERLMGLNPLVEDFLVTVVYRSLLIQVDGDGGADTGDFSFEFNVRLPSETSVTGLANRTIIVSDGLVESVLPPTPNVNDTTQSLVNNESFDGVQIGDNVLLNLADWLTLESRSIAFSLTRNQRFSVEGIIDELDASSSKVTVNYGGLEGLMAKKDGGEKVRTVFDGSSLTLGSITDLTFVFDGPDNVGNLAGGGIKGELKAIVIVS